MLGKQLDEEAIFKVACRITSAEARADYLQQACGHDEALSRRVATLLRLHDQDEGFLEIPAGGVVATIDLATITEKPGTLIGPYKLLEQIGEGGMGVVFMAKQTEPVRRKVALKIIKPGMDTKEVVARFEAERQALALMDHPNIAKVHDGGATESGRPYFVMELVRGMPITEYCDKAKLTTDQRLELFVKVCQAVQHAHQKGIIHRDIKPSNVMVTLYDGEPVPKVIDFGVAKATGPRLTEQSAHTNFAEMVGTPLYMSPEQAELSALDVDTRSDGYSLGVLLYELLTGTTPFDKANLRKAGYDEIRRIIREQEPPKPSDRLSTVEAASLSTISEQRGLDPRKLTHTLRGDLDWIVMKALEKDRTRRYETASALAADVSRYLADEPIEAKRPTLIDRIAKWSRRHRTAVFSAAAILVVAVVGLAISTMLVWREQKRTDTERARAEARLRVACDAVDRLLIRVGDDEYIRANVRHAEMFLEDAIQLYQTLLEQSDDPSVRRKAARAYITQGTVKRTLGRFEEASAALLQAVTLTRELVEEFPDQPDYKHMLATCHLDLGAINLHETDGRPSDAGKEALQRAVVLLDQLVTRFPEVVKYQSSLADALNDLASAYWNDGRLDEAEKMFRRVLSVSDGLPERVRTTADELSDRGATLSNLGMIRLDRGDPEQATDLLHEAIAFQRRALAVHPKHPTFLRHLQAHQWNLAETLFHQGRYTEATAAAEETVRSFPEVLRINLFAAEMYLRCAEYTDDDGTSSEARQFRQRASELLVGSAKATEITSESMIKLAWHLLTWPDISARDPQRALRLAEGLVKAFPQRAHFRRTLGVAYYRLGKWDDAVIALQKSTELNSGGVASDWFFLAMANWQRGDTQKAGQWYKKALEEMEKIDPEEEETPDKRVLASARKRELRDFRAEADELMGETRVDD